MGAAVSVRTVITAVAAVVTAAVGLVHELRRDAAEGNIGANPVMDELEERVKEARRYARQAERARQEAEEGRERAEDEMRLLDERLRRLEEDRGARDEEKRAAEEHKRRMDEEVGRMQRDGERREAAIRNANDGAEAKRKEAEEAQRLAEKERDQLEQRRRAAAEEQRRAEESQKRNAEARRKAVDDAQTAKLSRTEAEQAAALSERAGKDGQEALETTRQALRDGIRPVILPTQEELDATKARLQYREDLFHFAIAGIAGSGKSSLVNAVRGLRNGSRDALVAPTGVVETTGEVARYPDPNPANPFVWYDVPGAGTLAVPDWVYFNAQGLYAFDCIVLLIDARFTQTDEAVLRNCRRFMIPAYIVRSKSKQHIQNVLEDMQDDEDEDEDARRARAREAYIAETTGSVAQNLARAQLPAQRVYVVDKETMVQVVNGWRPMDFLDEWDLLRDLLSEARARRVRSAARR